MASTTNKSLKHELWKSHMLVVSFYSVIILLVIAVIIWFRSHTTSLINQSVPSTQTISHLQGEVQKSLALLRGWVATGDPNFAQQRKRFWQDSIWPNFAKLKRLSQYSSERDKMLLDDLERQLRDLEECQWYIEDVAQTSGNFPAEVILEQDIVSVYNKIFKIVGEIIDVSRHEGLQNHPVIFNFADFRGFFVHAKTFLISFVEEGKSADEIYYHEHSQKTWQTLAAIEENIDLLSEHQQFLFRAMKKEIAIYKDLTTSAIAMRKSKQWNICLNYLNDTAIPLAREIEQRLSNFEQAQYLRMKADTNQVNRIGNMMPWFFVLCLIASLFLAHYIASLGASRIIQPIDALVQASQELAKNRLDHDIAIMDNDELGRLTASFNTMRANLAQRRRELEQKEELTRGVIETAVDAIIIIDERGIIQKCNSATTKMLGYETEELVGDNISLLMPSPHRQNHNQYLGDDLQTGINKVIGTEREVMAQHKEGREIPVSLAISAVRLGEETLFTWIIRNITKAKQAEEEIKRINRELRAQNEMKTDIAELTMQMRGDLLPAKLGNNILRYLARNLNIQIGALYLLQDNTLRLTSSYAGERLAGNSREFALGEGLVGQCAVDRKSIIINEIPADAVKITTGMGSIAPKNILLLPILFEDEVNGVLELGSLSSFSERKVLFLEQVRESIGIYIHSAQSRYRLQELLEESQRKSQELSIQQEELRVINEELEGKTRMLELSQGELQQQSDELKTVNQRLAQQAEKLQQQKENLELTQVELEKKAEELQRASEYKSEFLANMSHELRNPLNSILLVSEMMGHNDEDNLTEEQQELLQVINKSGRNLLFLINDILDLSKVEAGALDIYFEETKIEGILANLECLFSPLAQEKGVVFTVEKGENATESIATDNHRVEQILRNLLSNALKFTHEGSITLRLDHPGRNVHFTRQDLQRETTVGFSIIDTGIGIPEQKQQLIFESFQQADGSTTRKYGGTGLGLTISRNLASLLGGELQVQSEPGVGSTFTLYLPYDYLPISSTENEREVAVIPEKEQESPGKSISIENIRILFVENDEHFQAPVIETAQDHGFQFTTANNGQEAYQMLLREKFDCIILALMLPDMDGLQWLQKASESVSYELPPVVVYTKKELSYEEHEKLSQYSMSIVVKEGTSVERLIDEVYAATTNPEPDTILSVDSGPTKHDFSVFCGKKLLLVDDDEKNTFVLAKFLNKHGIDVVMARNGQLAIEKLDLQPDIDFVFTDIMMPVMDGYELISKIRNEKKLSRDALPIIAITAKAMQEERSKCIEAGANEYLTKPIDISKLFAMMKTWLEKENGIAADTGN